jgi:alkylhydroperoxidase/carboxymuconolactone decarboxylase family protein YurZ
MSLLEGIDVLHVDGPIGDTTTLGATHPKLRLRADMWREALGRPRALDVPHSWTALSDAVRTLVTIAVDERAWGKAWLTVRALAIRFASLFSAPAPKLSEIPYPVRGILQ